MILIFLGSSIPHLHAGTSSGSGYGFGSGFGSGLVPYSGSGSVPDSGSERIRLILVIGLSLSIPSGESTTSAENVPATQILTE